MTGRMPNFLIIGAAKAGTTAVYAYLSQHPQVFMSEWKEPSFFALEGDPTPFAGPRDAVGERQRTRDLAGYQALFRGATDEIAVGEASTLYLSSSERAAGRIRRALPAVKLIAILRNPVERAYSAYRYLVRDEREPLDSFEAALDAEDGRIRSNWEPIWAYRAGGCYYTQLKRYYDLFPREQIAVHLYEDFERQPESIIREMFGFLGVDPTFEPDMSIRYNVSGDVRSRIVHSIFAAPSAAKDVLRPLLPRAVRQRLRGAIMERNTRPTLAVMAPETRQALTAFYREDTERLAELLGRDLAEWRDPDA